MFPNQIIEKTAQDKSWAVSVPQTHMFRTPPFPISGGKYRSLIGILPTETIFFSVTIFPIDLFKIGFLKILKGGQGEKLFYEFRVD